MWLLTFGVLNVPFLGQSNGEQKYVYILPNSDNIFMSTGSKTQAHFHRHVRARSKSQNIDMLRTIIELRSVPPSSTIFHYVHARQDDASYLNTCHFVVLTESLFSSSINTWMTCSKFPGFHAYSYRIRLEIARIHFAALARYNAAAYFLWLAGGSHMVLDASLNPPTGTL